MYACARACVYVCCVFVCVCTRARICEKNRRLKCLLWEKTNYTRCIIHDLKRNLKERFDISDYIIYSREIT